MISRSEVKDLYDIVNKREEEKLQDKLNQWLADNEYYLEKKIKEAIENNQHKVFIHPYEWGLDREVKYKLFDYLENLGYRIQTSVNNFYIYLKPYKRD